jgi:ubiquinol-cytochrome c reductase cytochrome c subunit
MKRATLVFASMLLFGSLPVLAQAPAGNAARGKDVYLKVGCDQCHGREAQGSPVTAPRLGPSPLPAAAFTLFIRKPRLQMPAYGPQILSDADIADIYAYVSSRAAPVAIDKLPH